MYDMPNGKERRRIAKSLGLTKKRSKLSFSKYCEELQRSINAGKEINRAKTEETLRNVEEQLDQIETKQRIFEESITK